MVAATARPGKAPGGNGLPPYAETLSAFHRACAAPLRTLIEGLPLGRGANVLDSPCGDGTYLPWLAERVGPGGRVVGADGSDAYLAAARKRVAAASGAGARANVEFVRADMPDLPFAEGSFDLVWCAHSLYSLPDPAAEVRGLARVVRPGGMIGVLENDSFHHWLLPWPVELELAVRRAQLAALERQSGEWQKHYIGRQLGTLLADVGLVDVHVTTCTIDHRAPLSADERTMTLGYLTELRTLIETKLATDDLAALDAFIDGHGSDPPAVDRADFFAAHLEILATARTCQP